LYPVEQSLGERLRFIELIASLTQNCLVTSTLRGLQDDLIALEIDLLTSDDLSAIECFYGLPLLT
jgi:hypothetical protein